MGFKVSVYCVIKSRVSVLNYWSASEIMQTNPIDLKKNLKIEVIHEFLSVMSALTCKKSLFCSDFNIRPPSRYINQS